MFKKSPNFNLIDTIIDSSSRFEGTLTYLGSLVIKGNVIGDIKIQKDDSKNLNLLTVLGNVSGDAECDYAFINGKFAGDLVVKKFLKVGPKGKIIGSVKYGSFVVEKGGNISGTCYELEKPETDKIKPFSILEWIVSFFKKESTYIET